MKIKVKFPIPTGGRNWKAIREAVLLDTMGNAYEADMYAAAVRAASPGQEVFVSRSYGPAGRFSVWIVDQDGKGSRMERRKALQAALGRVGV